MRMRVDVTIGVISFYVFLLWCRSEIKLWSPLSSEGGKTHPYKMNLESEPKVCVFCSIFQMVGNSILSEPYSFWKAVHSLPIPPTVDFFLLTANDEVIVYFPTGGFLGDSSLSARLWHSLQFLPTEWKVEAKVWPHVGNGLTCLGLCVFHTCAHFAHIHFNTC